MRLVVCSALVLASGCNALFGLDPVGLDDGDAGTSSDGGDGGGGPDAGARIPTRVSVCSSPRALVAAAADTSNDLDLITTCSEGVGVTLNTGLHQYAQTATINLAGTVAMAVGDVNGDGWNDLAVAQEILLGLYLGDGSGAFTSFVDELRAEITGLAIGDLVGDDGPRDIAAVTAAGVLIYAGSSGGLGTLVPVAQALTQRVALADLDQDNEVDLAIAGGNDTVTMRYQGNGYAATASSEVGGGALAAGDLVSGGGDELAVARVAMPAIAIAYPSGGGLESGTPALLTAAATAVAVGELDGDGFGDVAVITAAMPRLELFYNDGNRGLVPGPALPLDAVPSDVVIADLDGDHHDDVAVTMPTLGEVWIYWGPF